MRELSKKSVACACLTVKTQIAELSSAKERQIIRTMPCALHPGSSCPEDSVREALLQCCISHRSMAGQRFTPGHRSKPPRPEGVRMKVLCGALECPSLIRRLEGGRPRLSSWKENTKMQQFLKSRSFCTMRTVLMPVKMISIWIDRTGEQSTNSGQRIAKGTPGVAKCTRTALLNRVSFSCLMHCDAYPYRPSNGIGFAAERDRRRCVRQPAIMMMYSCFSLT